MIASEKLAGIICLITLAYGKEVAARNFQERVLAAWEIQPADQQQWKEVNYSL